MSKTGKGLQNVAKLLCNVRYEVFPLEGVEEAVLEHVPKNIELTVTASPNKGIWPTVELAGRLCGHGYEVVPHLSARLVRDEAQLSDIVERLQETGVRDVFVVGGDAKKPAGEFTDALGLLRTMHALGYGFERVGIAGYPEGHSFIGEDVLEQALAEKAPYASYIVSQICFDAGLTLQWARRVRQMRINLPIRVGMPGPVSTQKLARISARIGLGDSARFLKKQRHWLWRLLVPGGHNPQKLVEGLMPALEGSRETKTITGLHICTFNEIEKTETWRRERLKSLGEAA